MKLDRKRLLLPGLVFALSFLFLLPARAECAHRGELRVRMEPSCTEEGKEVYYCSICDEYTYRTLPKLNHDFPSNWTVDREPTCETPGEKSIHCRRCGVRTDFVEIPALGHSFSQQAAVVAPTCTDWGYTEGVCERCGLCVKSKYTEPTGHTPGLWQTDRRATCTEKGVSSLHCAVCDAVMEQKLLPTVEHAYTEQTVAPTCTQAGCALRTCRVCGAQTKTNTVKALGHSFPASGVQTKAPTCTEKGEEALTCTRCGAEKARSLSALGHSYGESWITDKASTCTARGEKSHHCIRCGKRRDVTSLPLAEHVPVPDAAQTDAATCEKAGKSGGTHCAVCGKTLCAATVIPALGHAFGEPVVLTAATCTEKGSAQSVCARCGKTEITSTPALGHSYSESWTTDKAPSCTAQGEQSHHCTRCGKRRDVTSLPRTEHFDVTDPVVEPTCTEKGKTAGAHCKYCGKVLIEQTDIPAKGHDFRRISTLQEPTCTEKGRAMMGCTVCGAAQETELPALGHSYDSAWTVDVPATCTARGEQSHHCIRCGKRADVTALPRTEHSIVYEGVVEPTCTKAGRADRAYCSVCGKELSEKTAIPARGHTPQVTVTAATTKRDGSAVTTCEICGETLKTAAIPRIKSVALSADSFVFSGKKRTPSVTVRDSGGKTLKAANCFTVQYAPGRKEIGRYTVTVNFCGDYAGSVTRTFKIVPRKPAGLEVSAGENRLALRWKPVRGATGYKVYLFNAETGGYTLLKTTKKPAFSMKKLLPGAVYLLHVRAFTKCGDCVLAGPLSARKAAATKPLAPKVAAKRQNGKAVLSWQPCGDCVYEIYAAEKKNGKFTLLGTTKKTAFTAGAFPAGSTRCFKVKAVVRQKTRVLSAAAGEIRVLQF